jgi:hypothetical protein
VSEILIYVNMDILMVVLLARKIKVTLSLREDVVRRARSKLAIEGRSLSDIVEEFLKMYDEISLLDRLCETLGFESRFCTSVEVKSGRPKGFKAEKIVREIRDERSEHLFGY